MRLVLRLAFLCFCFGFFVIYLLFAVWNLSCVWYRHVSRLAFHNKLPSAISITPYSQNQTSIKNFNFKSSEFWKFCEKSCYNSNTQVVFSPFFNSYKSRRKNLLDIGVVLIQALIRSPEHYNIVYMCHHLKNTFSCCADISQPYICIYIYIYVYI